MVGVAFLGVVGVGLWNPAPPVRKPQSLMPAMESGEDVYKRLATTVSRLPEVCLSGAVVNDFQIQQCREFWDHLGREAIVAALPFLLALTFFFIRFDTMRVIYKRAHQKITRGQALMMGTVTEPAEATQDAFGWLNCVRPIAVELSNKRQVKAYLPVGAPVPRPGAQVALYDLGRWMNQTRLAAALYAPHLAVFKGTRTES